MKKITLLFMLFSITTIVTAQQLYVEGGKTMSSFDYKNSQGSTLNNLQSTSHTFMEIGYRNQYFTEKLQLTGGLSYAGYGAIGSDDSVGNFMEWDLNYLQFNIGADYELYTYEKIALYAKFKTSLGFLVQGTQTLNNMVFDIKKADSFNNTLVNYNLGLGFAYPIADNLSIYMNYMYGKSFDLDSSKEELKISSNNLSFGLLINLPSNKNNQVTKELNL